MVERQLLSSKTNIGVKQAIASAIERHRRLGKSIVIWRDSKVVILAPEQIPQIERD